MAVWQTLRLRTIDDGGQDAEKRFCAGLLGDGKLEGKIATGVRYTTFVVSALPQQPRRRRHKPTDWLRDAHVRHARRLAQRRFGFKALRPESLPVKVRHSNNQSWSSTYQCTQGTPRRSWDVFTFSLLSSNTVLAMVWCGLLYTRAAAKLFHVTHREKLRERSRYFETTMATF